MKIVILSRKPENLRSCVKSILQNEGWLPILVVDDGAGTQANRETLPVAWIPGAKPFIFARNANIGIQAAADDVILLNDDAELVTPGGFTRLAEIGRQFGLTATLVDGRCGVAEQKYPFVAMNPGAMPSPSGRLAFIAVFIPKRTYQRVGPLDESFTKYGFDDDDYCLRANKLGLWTMICTECLVKHHESRMTFHGPEALNGITHWYDDDNRHVFHAKYPDRFPPAKLVNG